MRALAFALLVAAACACQSRPAPGLAQAAPRAQGPAQAPGAPSASARRLRIDTTPAGAEVLLGATPRCQTPCELRLDAGNYRLTLRKTGYLPYETSVVMPLGEDAAVSASLVGSH